MRALAGRSSADLDDLVQIAAEQVFRSVGSFDGRSDVSTWVYSICYRVLLRHRGWYRRWRERFVPAERDLDLPSDEPLPNALLEARERARHLQLALARLSDKYRAAVVLHDIEELDIRQVASIVGAGELTVRSRLRDGRKQLYKLLQAEASNGPYGSKHELSRS